MSGLHVDLSGLLGDLAGLRVDLSGHHGEMEGHHSGRSILHGTDGSPWWRSRVTTWTCRVTMERNKVYSVRCEARMVRYAALWRKGCAGACRRPISAVWGFVRVPHTKEIMWNLVVGTGTKTEEIHSIREVEPIGQEQNQCTTQGLVEREQVSKKHFHRLLVVEGLVRRRNFRVIRRGVPPHTYNITMQGRANIKQLDDGSVA